MTFYYCFAFCFCWSISGGGNCFTDSIKIDRTDL